MRALTFSSFGGLEVLEYREVADPVPQRGELLVKMTAIGLNFADIYRRRGNYHLKGSPPFIAGYEGAGEVLDPNGSSELRSGDRVAFADVPFANAEIVAVPLDHIIPLPEHISDRLAASLLLQGLTAHYLATDSHPIRDGEVVVVHAAAGGVGLLLVQICKLLGAMVIGVTSSPTKKAIVETIGADAVVLTEDWTRAVTELTEGRGVDVVYDGVGSTLTKSLQITRNGGHVVFYGMSGGDPEPVDPRMLMDRSLTLSGGDLWHYLSSRDERMRRATVLFDWVHSKKLSIGSSTTFALSDGRSAHELMESRRSTGKILLIP